jgi:hypothetical protein
MTFTTEAEFEIVLVQALSKKGWEQEVLKCRGPEVLTS